MPQFAVDQNGKFDALDDEMIYMILIGLIGGLIGLSTSLYLAWFRVISIEKGSDVLVEIANHIKEGAKRFLNLEYLCILVYVCLMLVLLGVVTPKKDLASTLISFIIGAALSAACGYCGMLIAVEANVRTTNAAITGLNEALQVAFGSGGVMGMSVVSVGLLGLVIVYAIWGGLSQEETRYLAGFGFGASSIALFARVGGGIYTKAADVGADLVGKVENKIPEDDPKNPATIADNVGDNVGDVAGMGADLFESFCGAIIASIQLSDEAVVFFYDYDHDTSLEDLDLEEYWLEHSDYDSKHFIALPLWITGFGIVSSVIGFFLVRTSKTPSADELQTVLLWTIRRGILTATFLSASLSLVTCGIFFGFSSEICWRLWGCTILGLIAGEGIGLFTEYTTSFVHKPTKSIAKKARVGSAGVIIQGLAIGMLSTAPPVMMIIVATLGCFYLAGNYGIGIAAVGMLSTLGITLSTDAFGPVADNAGGIAEMAGLPEEVRERTDGLDALGNTTAATGKGFCIGSAVLATLALVAAYKSDANIDSVDVSKAEVLVACIAGACLPYIFSALTMLAVGRAASLMIEEVRRQFKEYGLLEKEPKRAPDYGQCVAISTKASLIEMITPGFLAVCAPLICGFMLGKEALGGLLIGALVSGFMLAIFMANSGGAWDNAKKWIEADRLGEGKGKGTKYHAAAVVGDTVGDPFKDTCGPSLDILIKLMTMMSILFAPSFPSTAFDKDSWFVGLIVFFLFALVAGGIWGWMRHTGFGRIDYGNVNTITIKDDDDADGGLSRSLIDAGDQGTELAETNHGRSSLMKTDNKDELIQELREQLKKKDFEIQSLKEQLKEVP